MRIVKEPGVGGSPGIFLAEAGLILIDYYSRPEADPALTPDAGLKDIPFYTSNIMTSWLPLFYAKDIQESPVLFYTLTLAL